MATDLPPLIIPPEDAAGYMGAMPPSDTQKAMYWVGIAALVWFVYTYVLAKPSPPPPPASQAPVFSVTAPPVVEAAPVFEGFYPAANGQRVFVPNMYPVSTNNPPRMSGR